MPDTDLKSVDCEVIVKESATSFIVKDADGNKVNVQTTLPRVDVGTRGKLVTLNGTTVFIREPRLDD